MTEWLVIDKTGDYIYFNYIDEIAKYFNLSKPEVNAIYTYSLQNINRRSPSKKLYIQRLFTNPSLPPRDRSKIKFNKWAKYYFYPNIND